MLVRRVIEHQFKVDDFVLRPTGLSTGTLLDIAVQLAIDRPRLVLALAMRPVCFAGSFCHLSKYESDNTYTSFLYNVATHIGLTTIDTPQNGCVLALGHGYADTTSRILDGSIPADYIAELDMYAYLYRYSKDSAYHSDLMKLARSVWALYPMGFTASARNVLHKSAENKMDAFLKKGK